MECSLTVGAGLCVDAPLLPSLDGRILPLGDAPVDLAPIRGTDYTLNTLVFIRC
eukprot:COSAG01_NODE_8049_length_2940_cov_28.152763_1_plen_53_part_10